MRISDWSSDVCSSDLDSSIISFSRPVGFCPAGARLDQKKLWFHTCPALLNRPLSPLSRARRITSTSERPRRSFSSIQPFRSEEHTSELQSLMRISSAVFCLKKKKNTYTTSQNIHT